MNSVDLSVLIVSFNTVNLLSELFKCLDSASCGLHIQVIVVDNASSDGSVDWLRTNRPEVELVHSPVNLGFGRANNLALRSATGRYVLLLNTDAFVAPNTLTTTFEYMEKNSGCGVLGVKLTGRDGELQPSCRYFPTPFNLFLVQTGLDRFFKRIKLVDDLSWDHASVRDCDWVPGCYYLIRREVIDRVGLFDPRYFLYYEELDHCLSVKRAGWSVTFFPDTSVIHLGGESAKSVDRLTCAGRQLLALQLESELLFFRKNNGLLSVLADLALISSASVINILKLILRRQASSGWRQHLERLNLVVLLAFRTNLGMNPTR